MEETHVVDYVFDESRDSRWVLNHKFSNHYSYNMIVMNLSLQKNLFPPLVFDIINRKVFCVYGGYGMTCEQVQCLAKEEFIDILVNSIIWIQ